MKDMQRSATTIEVTPGSQPAEALDEGKPVVLVKDGVRYWVDREDIRAGGGHLGELRSREGSQDARADRRKLGRRRYRRLQG